MEKKANNPKTSKTIGKEYNTKHIVFRIILIGIILLAVINIPILTQNSKSLKPKVPLTETIKKLSKTYTKPGTYKIITEKPQWGEDGTASVKIQIVGDLPEGANPQYSIDGTDEWKAYSNTQENILTGLKYKDAIAVKIYHAKTKVTQTSFIHIKEQPSYVGYYADIDGNGVIDGIIYADLAIGGKGIWNNNSWSNYQYDAVSKGLKEYSISKTKAEGPYGERGVITKVKGTSGQDRFYVMALEDINAGTRYCWYDAASGKLDKIVSGDANDFGSGKENTNYVIDKWKREEWGPKDTGNFNDLWGVIKEKVNEGWFLPSKSEWAAFGDMMYTKLGMTTSNYNQTFGLSSLYWSSSQYDKYDAYITDIDLGGIGSELVGNGNVYGGDPVRLSATF